MRAIKMSRFYKYAFLSALIGFGAAACSASFAEENPDVLNFAAYSEDAAAPTPSPTLGLFSEAVEEDEESADAVEATDAVLERMEAELAKMREETESLKKRFDEKDADKSKPVNKNAERLSVKFGGQLKFDGSLVSQNDEALQNFGNAKNSVGVRDIRVTASGSGYGRLAYSFGFSIHDHITLRHAYVRVKDTPYFGDVTFGHFFVETGMESVQTNYDRYFTTVDENENFFKIGRRLGASSTYFGADKRSRLFFGIFASASIESAPERLNGECSGLILNTRYTAAPILVEDADGFTHEVFHFGGSYMWLDPAHTAPLVSRTRGMGWTGTNPYWINGILPLDGRSYSIAAAEIAYQKEKATFISEGFFRSIEKGGNAYGATNVALFMLTPGASRTYSRSDARFSGVKMRDEILFIDPEARVVGGGLGALEAVAKWEWTQANDVKNFASNAAGTEPPIYGTVNRFVLGANWFWNEQINWAFNWEHAFVDAKQAGAPKKGDFDSLVIQTSMKF